MIAKKERNIPQKLRSAMQCETLLRHIVVVFAELSSREISSKDKQFLMKLSLMRRQKKEKGFGSGTWENNYFDKNVCLCFVTFRK